MATAVLAAPVAEQGDGISVGLCADADVDLKKRNALPEEDLSIKLGTGPPIKIGKRDGDDDNKVKIGASAGVTKRDASPDDVTKISVGADGKVHIGRLNDDLDIGLGLDSVLNVNLKI